MIRLERTHDYALVASVMRHPRIYPWIADDYYPTADFFWPVENQAIRYLAAYEDGGGGAPLANSSEPKAERLLGICIAHPIQQTLWEVHHAILPRAWGRKALRIGEAFQAWIWQHTKAERIVGFTPADNTLAIRFAKAQGMREEGRLARCYRREAKLHDLLILSKSRPAESR